MSRIEERMQTVGLRFPPDWQPRGAFLPYRRDGPVVYLSGQICEWDGTVTHQGPVDDTDTAIAAAQDAARVCALNLLYRLREACGGSLDNVDCILRLGGFVNCRPGFGATPTVINGATKVFVDLFGEPGWHARTAVGVSGLPGNAAVEVDAIVRLRV